MAKKKKSGNSQKISTEKFMQERVRKLPIGKCYVNENWEEAGMADVVVSRVRRDGNLAVCIFLVDTFCLGVKDVICKTNIDHQDFKEILKNIKATKEISYNEAHNLILGAIEFAEEAGISPCKDFSFAQYILEEDTDEIPLISYDYGKDGKHLLIAGPTGKERLLIPKLRKNLGDNFNYILPLDMLDEEYDQYDDEEDYDDYDDDEYYDEEESDSDFFSKNPLSDVKDTKDLFDRMKRNSLKIAAEDARHPMEEYDYEYPEYPTKLEMKHPFIAEELKKYNEELPKEVQKSILSLPKEEVAEDLANLILFTIGQTYSGINDGSIESIGTWELAFALDLLAETKSDKALDALLELLRQNRKFTEMHLGIGVAEIFIPALSASGKNHLDKLEKFLYQPGIDTFNRAIVTGTLSEIAQKYPKRRHEIIEIFRRIINFIIPRLPNQDCCDGLFAGLLTSNLTRMKAMELIPEIKALYATNCVNKNICGDVNEMLARLN